MCTWNCGHVGIYLSSREKHTTGDPEKRLQNKTKMVKQKTLYGDMKWLENKRSEEINAGRSYYSDRLRKIYLIDNLNDI